MQLADKKLKSNLDDARDSIAHIYDEIRKRCAKVKSLILRLLIMENSPKSY